jgi:uncharacterized membrane protein YphA (DoxX/SURF4 family)
MSQRQPLLGRIDHTGAPLLLARLGLGGMFVWLGVAKILDPVSFLKLMKQYNVLPLEPPYFMNVATVVVPWIEMVVGAALLLGIVVRGAGVVSVIMLLLFTPLIYLRGMELYNAGGFETFCAVNFDCGCGTGVVNACNKLAEDCGLLIAAIIAAASRSRRFCLSALFSRGGASASPRISVS